MSHRLGVIAALAAMSFVGAALAADAKRVPIAAFVRGAEYKNPRLSPDGRHLAVRAVLRQEEGDLHLLTIYDLASMKATSTMRMQKYEMPGNLH